MSKRAESVPPTDPADRHPPQPAADILRYARCLRRRHQEGVKARVLTRKPWVGNRDLAGYNWMQRHVDFFAWLGLRFVQNRRPRMKSLRRTIFTIAGGLCASISLTPSPAAGAEENFFQKFIVEEPMNWSGFYVGFNNGASFNDLRVGQHMTDVDLEKQFYDIFPAVL